MTPLLQSQVAMWRAKAAAGTLTEEEMIEAVKAIREGRIGAAQTAVTRARAAAKVAIPNAEDLLNDLEGL